MSIIVILLDFVVAFLRQAETPFPGLLPALAPFPPMLYLSEKFSRIDEKYYPGDLCLRKY